MIKWILLLCAGFVVFSPAVASAQTLPGDACTIAGAYRQSGGAELPDGYVLVCDGSNWKTVLDYKSTGPVLFRLDYDATPCAAALEGEIRYDIAERAVILDRFSALSSTTRFFTRFCQLGGRSPTISQ